MDQKWEIEFDSEHIDLGINRGKRKSEIPTAFKSKSRKLMAPQHLPKVIQWQLHPGNTSGIPGDPHCWPAGPTQTQGLQSKHP